MSQPRQTTTYLLLAGVLLLPGCAAKEREEAMAVQPPGHEAAFGSTQQTSEPRATEPSLERANDDGDESTEIYADVELLATCGMEAPTVYFEYDSANVRRAAQVELTELAECMQRPPLADRKLEVIGHADERGPEQYNEGLGLRRATAVTDQLITHGLDRTRVQARSHGEEEAANPPEWTDRRVVIRLQDEATSPSPAPSPTPGSKQDQSPKKQPK
jgi:outer membrane protein OmpA-like peptidoglycan-associated protein